MISTGKCWASLLLSLISNQLTPHLSVSDTTWDRNWTFEAGDPFFYEGYYFLIIVINIYKLMKILRAKYWNKRRHSRELNRQYKLHIVVTKQH